MSFAPIRTRLVDAVFARLGEAATWTGVDGPVQVRPTEREEAADFGQSRDVVLINLIRVRRSEVPAAAIGQAVTLADDGRVFTVMAEPILTRNAVWICQVAPVAA